MRCECSGCRSAISALEHELANLATKVARMADEAVRQRIQIARLERDIARESVDRIDGDRLRGALREIETVVE